MNNTVFLFLYNFAHQSASMDKVIVFFATDFPYVVVVLAILFLLFNKSAKSRWGEFFYVFLSAGVASLAAKMLKTIIHADRPFLKIPEVHSLFSETGFAFPSGHATFFSAIAFAIFFHHKKAGYVFMVFAFVIGLARIVGGVHFPIDILGGFALGALVAYLLKSV